VATAHMCGQTDGPGKTPVARALRS